MSNDLRERLTSEPTTTFGVDWETEGEVVGPMKPLSVNYGVWSWNFHGPFPMLTFNFNKYNAHLPPWSRVREAYLASERATALFEVSHPIETQISGHLKSVHVAALTAREGRCDGDIISCTDVLRTSPEPSESKRDSSSFKVTEVLE